MTKQTLLLIIFLSFIPCQLNPASVQHAQLMAHVFAVMDSRVQFEQLKQMMIQRFQQSKSLDQSLVQTILDYYGYKAGFQTKNEAIERILRDRFAKTISRASSNGVIVLEQEIPRAVSQVAKFDFNVRNELAACSSWLNDATRRHAFSYKSEHINVSLDVRPICQPQSAYEQMVERVNYRNFLQEQIKNDVQLWFSYLGQRAKCVELIKRMLNLSSNPDALLAQLSVNNLSLTDVFDDGAMLTDWVKPGIQNMLFKNGNFVGIDTQEKLGKFLEIVAPFFKAALPKENYIELLQECKTIPGAEILLKRALGLNSYWDAFKNCVNNCLSFYPYSIDREIADSRMIKNCADAVALCKAEKFDQARNIVTSLRTRTNSEERRFMANEAYYLSALIENEYSAVFNSYGVRYKDTADPQYAIAKSLLDSCPVRGKLELQKAVQETIAFRSSELDKLLKHATSLQQKSSYIRAIGYKILDAQNNNEMVDILASFAKDHADDNGRNAYSVFVSKGLPRSLLANECAKNISMPAAIELVANEEARKWYGYCACLKIESDIQKELINRALTHVAQACQEGVCRQDHLSLAEHFYTHAVAKNSHLLKLPDLTYQFKKPAQNALKKQLLSNICDSLKEAEDSEAALASVEKTQKVWTAIQSEQIKTLKELEDLWNSKPEDHLLSATSEIYLEKEIEKVEEEFKPPYGCGNSVVQEIQRALFDFGQEIFEWQEPYGGQCFPWQERAKNLYDPEAEEIKEVIDIDEIPQCNGGQQTLPSFGESREGAEDAQGDEKQIEEIKKKLKKIDEIVTSEEKIILDEFFKDLEKLIDSVGIENVKEAIEVEGINIKKIIKMPHLSKILTWLAKSLARVNSEEGYKSFKYDAAKNGKVDKNSIEEALAGIAAVEQKFFEMLSRSSHDAEEFLDQNGVAWDVKTAKSYSWEGKSIFNVDKFIDAVKKEFRGSENVILQVTDLNDSDSKILYRELHKKLLPNEIARIIVIHANDSSKSMTSERLKLYLETYVD